MAHDIGNPGVWRLRIHLTSEDLARTRVADGPDTLWELVMGLQVLQARYGRLAFAEWRHRVRADLRRRELVGLVRRLLFPLTPVASYFPDFLNPPEGRFGLAEGVEAVLATSPRRIGQELETLHDRHGVEPWLFRLADRRTDARELLGNALVGFHRAAIAPYWPRLRARVDADRAVRLRALRNGGIEAVLTSLQPTMRWRPPVLELPGHPSDRDVYPGGRGLLLIPSCFCWNHPITIFDPALPQVVVYPVEHDPNWLSTGPDRGPEANTPLARLLGATRAAILRATGPGSTTGELANRVGVAPTTVSEHTAVLRAAGLITSHRHANTVTHILTPLGTALVRGTALVPRPVDEGR